MARGLQGIYPEKLFASLAAGKVLPAYYLAGDDRLEKQAAREKLLARLKPDESCVHKFTGQEVQPGDLVGLAESLSLFGGTRLIWVEDAHRLAAAAKKPLGDYLASPNPSTCLVFASDEWKTDPSDPVIAGAFALGGLVHFRAPTGERLLEWVRRTAKSQDLTLAPEALDLLVTEAGEDRVILAQELARLALFKNGSTALTTGGATASAEDVAACLGYSEAKEIWDLEKALTGAMAERSVPARRKVVTLVEALLEEGEQPIKVSNYVSYAVQKLLAAKRLQQAGLPAMAVKAKVGAWGNEEIAGHAQRVPEARLIKALRLCLDLDVRLKSGAPAPEMEVRELVLRLTA